MSESLDNATTKLAHVLFMDIVGYSILPTDEQNLVSTKLKEIVRATPQVSAARNEDELISLYTGDGIALVFFTTPLAPVECAVAISRALKQQPDVKLRMGIHSGLVQLIVDVNDKLNVAGGGINTAQRVMDCGDDGHILVSRRVADDLVQFRKWQPMLHDLGEARVKHDQSVHIVNLYSDEVGNPAMPAALRKAGSAQRSSFWRNIAIGSAGLAVLLAAAVYFTQLRQPAIDRPTARPESDFTSLFARKKDAWVERIFTSQAPSGGIKASPSDRDITHQTWATAQCLVAALEADAPVETYGSRIKRAFEYMESERRTAPTEGWSLYGHENDIYTITEIAAWVAIAKIRSVDAKTPVWSETERPKILSEIERELSSILKRQDSDGGFRPIIDEDPEYSRTYSTVMALWSLLEARRSPAASGRIGTRFDENIRRSINWLMRTYKEKQGWVHNPNRMGQTARFDGLTAQTLFVLAHAAEIDAFAYVRDAHTYKLAQTEFVGSKHLASSSVEKDNSSIPDGDVRFAGTEFVAEGSTFLWFPWVLVELAELSTDTTVPEALRKEATSLRLDILTANYERLENYVEIGNFSYILAENLFCAAHYIKQMGAEK
jgi:class 3 adenylate cyclase